MSEQGEPRREKPSPYQAPKAEVLLRRAIEAVEGARPVPLSSDSRINKDELLEMLNEVLGRLPDELRAARWLLKEREEFLAKTRREGDEILELARVRAARMVERTEVVRESESRARQLIDDAESEARRMRYEVEDYCDRKLGSFEIVLQRTLKSVAAGRAKLQGVGRPGLAEGRAQREANDGQGEGAVFDQDIT
jgi:hypothetical protein